MIDLGLALIGAVLYFTGLYGFALILIGLAIISGVGAVIKSIVNPDWYYQQRMQAGLDVDFFSNKQIRSLILTKIVVVGLLLWAAWHIAVKAGYIQ